MRLDAPYADCYNPLTTNNNCIFTPLFAMFCDTIDRAGLLAAESWVRSGIVRFECSLSLSRDAPNVINPNPPLEEAR